MIFTKSKNYDEIKKHIDEKDVITIISCTSCARTAGTGGEEPMKNLALKLRNDGYTVLDGYTINTMCTPKVLQAKIDKKVNTLITMSCSAGTSNIKKLFDGYKVIETTDDVGLMTGNNKLKTIKVAVPYEGYEDVRGKEFKMYIGEPIDSAATKTEVAK